MTNTPVHSAHMASMSERGWATQPSLVSAPFTADDDGQEVFDGPCDDVSEVRQIILWNDRYVHGFGFMLIIDCVTAGVKVRYLPYHVTL